MTVAVCLLVFLSGISGLIYQVLWAKQLSLLLGSTAWAHTVVLSVYMGGLSLGNAWLGPKTDRSADPLRFFAWLELAIAVLGLASLPLLHGLGEIYIRLAGREWLSPGPLLALKLALSAGVLLAPTIAMGGTLPALTRWAARDLNAMEGSIARFYFLNSAGAAVGAAAAGFLLIPFLGMDLTLFCAVLLNLGVGAAVLALQRSKRSTAPPAAKERAPTQTSFSPRLSAVYALIFISGFVALAYEIAWIRLLTLILGSSTYSFSLMLSAFIAGIALGSALVTSRWLVRLDPFTLLGLSLLGVGFSVLAGLPFGERLPHWFLVFSASVARTPSNFYLFEAGKFLFCFALMAVPAAFLGISLPAACRAAATRADHIGRTVGRVFAVNTLGNVLGAATAGLLLLPWLGIHSLLAWGASLHLLSGCGILLSRRAWPWSWRAALCLAAFSPLLWHWATPSWDNRVLSSGAYRRLSGRAPSYEEFRAAMRDTALLYHKDDSEATVAVVRSADGILYLKVNGKTDASTGVDMATQQLLAHIPLLLKGGGEDVLIVGLGSGITAGSALLHPIKKLDVVELVPAVAEAASLFASHNHNALQDPRLRLILDDANSYLRTTPRGYDVIISEPPNPWIAGVGNLFSADFYRAAKARLRPGGVFAQWFHLYEMSDELVQVILRTFSASFAHVTLWRTPTNDIILIGSAEPLEPAFRRLEAAFKSAPLREDIERIGIKNPMIFLSLQAATDAGVRRMAGRGPINEDRHPVLEYQAPKAFFLDRTATLISEQDERIRPVKGSSLLLTHYLQRRGKSLSNAEFKEIQSFHRRQ